jgi:hypothetical protein
MEQGFAAISAEVFLVISIPIYVLFLILLFCYPQRRSKGLSLTEDAFKSPMPRGDSNFLRGSNGNKGAIVGTAT